MNLFEINRSVHRLDLNVAAQAALKIAMRAAASEERPDAPPTYQRLALSPAGTLHTVAFRPGELRSIRYEHDPYDDSDEPHLANRVTAVRPIADGYMVVPNRNREVLDDFYLDTEPDYFGPGADHAKAFWIAGPAQFIVDGVEEDWAIVPVRFYDIEEQIHTDDELPLRPL